MDWLDLAFSVAVIWIALDIAVLAMLIAAAARRNEEAGDAQPPPPGRRRLRLVRSRPGSARTRA